MCIGNQNVNQITTFYWIILCVALCWFFHIWTNGGKLWPFKLAVLIHVGNSHTTKCCDDEWILKCIPNNWVLNLAQLCVALLWVVVGAVWVCALPRPLLHHNGFYCTAAVLYDSLLGTNEWMRKFLELVGGQRWKADPRICCMDRLLAVGPYCYL